MIGNVISFPPRRLGADRSAEARAEEARQQRLKRLYEIERDIERANSKKGLVFKRRADIESAAQAIGRLYEAAKAHGVPAGAIRVQEGLPRIDRYMLPADAEQGGDRLLLQPVKNYLSWAKRLAELAGKNAEDAKVDVLASTTLWHGKSLRATEADERADWLARLLREMTDSVMRTSGVSEFFERCKRVPGRWNAEDGAFDRVGTYGFSGERLSAVAYQNWNEHWSEVPPLPSVPLVRLLHSEIDVTLKIGAEGTPRPRRDADRILSDFEGREQLALIRLYREIRLAIGPTTAPDQIGGMFESRPHIEIWLKDEAGDKLCTLDPPWDLAPLYDSAAQIAIAGGWYRARALTPWPSSGQAIIKAMQGQTIHDPVMWDHAPLSKECQFMEHSYFSWTPLSADYVEHWLDNRAGEYVGVIGSCDPESETWYQSPNPAGEVEVSLTNGSLERMLKTAVDKLAQALTLREREWREAASKTSAALIDRWRTAANDAASIQETE